MPLNPKKLEDVLRLAAAPLLALGSLYAAAMAGVEWIEPLLGWLGVYARPVAIGLVAIPVAFLLWASFHALSKRSRLLRPERFDLRLTRSEDLLGRDRDIADLAALLERHSLVFLEGESGSGKSSLLAYGLMPELKARPELLPVLIADYGGDWERGPVTKAHETVWEALSPEDRARLGVASRPPVGAVTAETLAALLNGIASQLGRTPVLLLDQFDDYQMAFRPLFLDSERAWIAASDLVARNLFWRTIDAARAAGRLRLLVVTRSDSGAGLHSVRFTEDSSVRSLLRLDVDWLPGLLAQAVRDDGAGPVIRDADQGWEELERAVQRDLRRQGPILPQQIRVTLLGLRKLPALTPAHYRRAGGLSGVEALYVRNAILSAAEASGAAEQQVRALLLLLVEKGPQDSAKTVVRSEAELGVAIPEPRSRARALERLEGDEIIRRRLGDGPAEQSWQLDHDYLARAVLAEERMANRAFALLRDRAEAWREAGPDLRQWFRLLLPLRTQFALAWARIRRRAHGNFAYGPYRGYAAASLLRLLPVLLAVAIAGWGWMELRIRGQSSELVASLVSEGAEGDRAVLALWAAPQSTRSRSLEMLLDNPSRLSNANAGWAAAYTSLDGEAARSLIRELFGRVGLPLYNDDQKALLMDAVSPAASRLEPEAAAEVLSGLLERRESFRDGDRMELPWTRALAAAAHRLDSARARQLLNQVLIPALGREAPGNMPVRSWRKAALENAISRLGPADAREVNAELMAGVAREGSADRKARLLEAASLTGGVLVPAEARSFANRLLAGFERETAPEVKIAWLKSLAPVAGRLDPADANARALDLLVRYDNEPESSVRSALGEAFVAAAAQLAPGHAASLLDRFLGRLAPEGGGDLAMLAAVGGRLDASRARDFVARMWPRVDAVQDKFVRRSWVVAMTPAASRLAPDGARAAAGDVLRRLTVEENKDDVVGPELYRMVETVAGRLGSDDARWLLESVWTDTALPTSGIGTFDAATEAAAIRRLDPADAKEVADKLLHRFAVESDPSVKSQVGLVLMAAAARLGAEDAVELRARLLGLARVADPGQAREARLIDVLAGTAAAAARGSANPGPGLVRDLLLSVAYPLRDPADSPMWPILERLANRKFSADIAALTEWARSAYEIDPSTIRPSSP